jgi:hypothetical protein
MTTTKKSQSERQRKLTKKTKFKDRGLGSNIFTIIFLIWFSIGTIFYAYKYKNDSEKMAMVIFIGLWGFFLTGSFGNAFGFNKDKNKLVEGILLIIPLIVVLSLLLIMFMTGFAVDELELLQRSGVVLLLIFIIMSIGSFFRIWNFNQRWKDKKIRSDSNLKSAEREEKFLKGVSVLGLLLSAILIIPQIPNAIKPILIGVIFIVGIFLSFFTIYNKTNLERNFYLVFMVTLLIHLVFDIKYIATRNKITKASSGWGMIKTLKDAK